MIKYLLLSLLLLSFISCGGSGGNGTGNNVSTITGSGTPGNTDGASDSAELNGPSGVAVAPNGDIWMTDGNNNSVRLIDPNSGAITTEANTNGAAGFTDGDAATARFNNPDGIAVDSVGNVYVADIDNNAIRKIDGSTGITSTVAGNGVAGSNDGAISSATFDSPTDVIIDNEDDNILYVADEMNHVIRKIDLNNNQVSTIIGTSDSAGDTDASGTSARLRNPHAMTIDQNGYIYVTDKGNHKVKKFHKTSTDVTTIAGTGVAGDGAEFNNPHGIAVDQSGNIFVADESNNKVKKISVGSIVSTIAGTGEAGFSDTVGALAKLNSPTGLAINGNGDLILCDTNNHRIRKIAK